MNTRRTLTRAHILAGLPLIAAACAAAAVLTAPAAAQSLPPITSAKRAATSAVQATNRHTAAMTNTASDSSAPRHTAAAQAGKAAPPKPSAAPRAAAPAAKAAAPGASRSAAAGARKTAAASPDTTRAAVPVPGADASSSTSIADRGGRSEFAVDREVFAYESASRRDPFLSLMDTGELRPMLSDLVLTAIVFDPNGNSVAVLRDRSTDDQYRVKAGQELGRMRVTAIRQKAIVLTIEEYGYSRQEILALNDSNTARTK